MPPGARDRDFTTDEMAQMFLDFGDDMLKALVAGGKAAVMTMSSHAVTRELNFPKDGPSAFPGLRRQTGRLQRNVAASPEAHAISEKEGEASFGTTEGYGIDHERGFEGPIQVPAHTRRIATRNVYEGRKKTAQGVAFVREHERYVMFPARRYLGRTLETDAPLGDRLIDRALWLLITTGHVPTPDEVGSGEAS
jgi:hypothetical protein